MRILLLISESWNDIAHPNNNLTNWFFDFPNVELFTISGGQETPCNQCCKNFFMLSDLAMMKSFFPGHNAGKTLFLDNYPIHATSPVSSIENMVYGRSDKLHYSFIRLIRDFIWRYGRINIPLLKNFLAVARPDVIFSARMGSVKMGRLENLVKKYTNAPIVAYTGDNEYLQDGLTGGLFDRLHTLWVRHWLDEMIPRYYLYYSMSQIQMDFYQKKYGVKTKFLTKCGVFSPELVHTKTHDPIRLVYAGKLYCGRDRTLEMIVNVLREFNREKQIFVLDLYTVDLPSRELSILFNDGHTSNLHPAVSAGKLQQIYGESDIVLHVEALEGMNVQKTKYSFSTKIMDCLSCGAAVMAVCHPSQAGFDYLKMHDIALVASDENSLRQCFNRIAASPKVLSEYAQKAYEFGKTKHTREQTQKMLMADFRNACQKVVPSCPAEKS